MDRLARRLRTAHRVCRTVTLRLRFDDFARATRSHTVPEATADTGVLLLVARGLLTDAMPAIRRRGITLIGVTYSGLSRDDAVQLAFPLDAGPTHVLDGALDAVHERFGSRAITRGVLLGRRDGIHVPLLPD